MRKLIAFSALLMIFAASIGIAKNKTGSISVAIYGFENNNGKARILIFDKKNAENFPGGVEKAFIKKVVPIQNKKVLIDFDEVPYGEYAVSAHHDEDGNQKLNTNFIGIPNEGLGSSNDAKGNFGPPSFEQAKIILKKPKLSIRINIVN